MPATKAAQDGLIVPVNRLGQEPSATGFFKGIVTTKNNLSVINSYLPLPFISKLIKYHTNYTASILGPNIAVSKVGRVFAYTKVRATIIKSIAINVIDVLSRLCARNKPMHRNGLSIRKALLSIERMPFRVAHNTPLTTTITCPFNQFPIFFIEQNYHSAVPFAVNFHVKILTGVDHKSKGLI